jgi:trehalose 6-phosphate synthase
MTKFADLKNFFKNSGLNMIIASDADPRVYALKNGKLVSENSAGGVAVALDPIAQATGATYIARAKHQNQKIFGGNGITEIEGINGKYKLKRLYFDAKTVENYYYGLSNQTLWPLCHIAFEEPVWDDEWYEDYKKVNREYAKAIKKALIPGKKNFVWINDYQLALVPKYLGKPKNTTVAMFWHIPWPTWEIFRILPYKREILESMLHCDFLAFHRGYQARNFLQTVERELETRTDDETQKVFYNKNSTVVKNLPMGIDTDVVKSLVAGNKNKNGELNSAVAKALSIEKSDLDEYFEKHKVILGVSRLDYTKGIKYILKAFDRFYDKNRKYIKKATFISVIAPSREPIPAYQKVRKEALALAAKINRKYRSGDWKPINLVYAVFDRREVINFYHKADACIITPVDDGMNLVSKEFVVASSLSLDPGMLILSQFAGSAIDLTSALIVNPYDLDEVAEAIKKAIEMDRRERAEKVRQMTDQLEENNVYTWAQDFIRQALISKQ